MFQFQSLELADDSAVLECLEFLQRGPYYFHEAMARMACARDSAAHLYQGADGRALLSQEQDDWENGQRIPFEILRAAVRRIYGVDLPDDYGFENSLHPEMK